MPVLEPMEVRPQKRDDTQRRTTVSRYDGQSFPDVTEWSVDRIAEFVASAGFPDQAVALKEEVGFHKSYQYVCFFPKDRVWLP